MCKHVSAFLAGVILPLHWQLSIYELQGVRFQKAACLTTCCSHARTLILRIFILDEYLKESLRTRKVSKIKKGEIQK